MTGRVGIIGARGYVSQELIRLIFANPQFELGFVSSRARAGQSLQKFNPSIRTDMQYIELTPDSLSQHSVDALVLALPNGLAQPYVEAVTQFNPETRIVDLSADHRFDANWIYGLPELGREQIRQAARISNPGCYATAMQLAISPMRDQLEGPVQCFGVSGYSGAGTTASDKNNPDKLNENLIPYALAGHIHEREVSRHLNHPVEFMPHVAAYFRGLSITANLHLKSVWSVADVMDRYRNYFSDSPLVRVKADAPWTNQIAGRNGAMIGGFTLSEDGRRLVVVSVLDNLLKGAATQAMQNLNLAFGFDELLGINNG